MGKGSTPRPFGVSMDEYVANRGRIDWGRSETELPLAVVETRRHVRMTIYSVDEVRGIPLTMYRPLAGARRLTEEELLILQECVLMPSTEEPI